MYLEWYFGGIALAMVAVGHWLLLKTSFGVSGSYAKVANWKDSLKLDRARAMLEKNRAKMAAMMAAATAEEFGEQATDNAHAAPAPIAAPVFKANLRTHILFLVMIGVGAFLAAASRGMFALRTDMGQEFQELIASGNASWLVLLGGGLLVGFGTSMAGGCTSGHGISGNARLEVGSLLATAAFFGAGIVVSLLLEL